jgi:hypothetical protein
MHAEHSQADAAAEVYTLITSDQRKVWGNEFQPFPAEAKADIQASKALLSFLPNNHKTGAGLPRMPGSRGCRTWSRGSSIRLTTGGMAGIRGHHRADHLGPCLLTRDLAVAVQEDRTVPVVRAG